MSKRLFFTFLIPILILTVTILVVALGRGYRLDIKQKEVKPTGILVAESSPNGAQVFINNQFRAATNSNLNLEPDWYEVRIHKEGYQDWNKKMRLQGEVVVKTDAVLFPTNPSLSPLTTTGVTGPILSPDGTKIAFTATPSAQPATSSASPAGGQLPATYILDLTSRALSLNKNPRPYEGTWEELLQQWQTEATSLKRLGLSRLPENFLKVATTSAQILSFSPDESKVLYQATTSASLAKIIDPPLIGANPTEEIRQIKPDKIYVYDIKEDRNYEIREVRLKRPTSSPNNQTGLLTQTQLQNPALQWLSTSRHLILVEENPPAGEAGKISLMEYDGSNKVTVYSAPFVNSFVFPHPLRRSLIILTTLNPEASSIPNLYYLSLD